MPVKVSSQFRQAFEAIANDKMADLDIKKLEGFRLRISSYRAIFRRLDDVLIIEVVDIGSRGDIDK